MFTIMFFHRLSVNVLAAFLDSSSRKLKSVNEEICNVAFRVTKALESLHILGGQKQS